MPTHQYRVVTLAEVASTNAEAMRRAAEGERGPLWIAAARQTQGRGRSGRTWTSREGDLTATLLFAPRCQQAALYQLSLLAGVAVHDALLPLMPAGQPERPRLRLKWPNDILVGHAKLGGILVESSTIGATTMAAIGIGINIVAAPELSPRATTSLAARGASAEPHGLVETIAQRMETWLEIWHGGAGFSALRTAWLDRAGPVGEPMSVNTGTSVVTGTFAGIDGSGALLLQGHGGGHETALGQVRRFTFGDVTLTPHAAAEGQN